MAVLAATCVLTVVMGPTGVAQQPRFRSSVEVTSVDVAVVDGQGRPISGLTPGDFSVRVDGKTRRVVNAEWVPLAPGADAKPVARVPDGYSSNENDAGGRLIALAVDEPHIRPGGAAAVLAAAVAFIDRLSPSDRVAAVSLGIGGRATPFTADRELVKEAIGRMAGQLEPLSVSTVTISAAEALEIADGNRLALDLAATRECPAFRANSPQMLRCRQDVELQAAELANQVKRSTGTTIRALRDLLMALQPLDGPKTLILLSEGFSVRDALPMQELGALAAATRTSIYALKLDNELFQVVEATAIGRSPMAALGNDGLEALAAAARGSLFTVRDTGSRLFAHIESELSGYYLLGIESDPVDRDGRPHSIRIDVSRRGAIVRTRRQLLNVAADLNRPQTPREAVAASLAAPLLASALPLRVATFALRGSESAKVQLLIRAEVGTDYADARPAVVGYVIQDRHGRRVESRTISTVLTPVMNGVPGSLQYSAGASLDPGEYTIKLAVAEGDRVGSVEHPVHASLVDLGEVTLSELMVGGPTDPNELLRPTVGYTVSFGSLHGYLEAYGPHLDHVAARYEIAATPDGPALLVADVPTRRAGPDRALLTHVMTVATLPPGEYVLRATVTSSGEPLKTLARRFAIAPPAVLMASASGAPVTSGTSAELFLPVEEGLLARRFAPDLALQPLTLQSFLERVPDATKPAFEQGIADMRNADYTSAEARFKQAIRPDLDSTSALAYLAASMAATGRDADAAGAWQTALIDGSDLPQIYDWLAEALARTRDYAGARSILEEAVARWPGDARFGRTLAISYATLGRGRDAIRALDRYIAAGHSEPDLLLLMVEWIFQVHSQRAVVIDRATDLAIARRYAAAYVESGGPNQALVQQWLGFLESERP